MALLFDVLDLPLGSRLTGIWNNTWADEAQGPEVATGHFISLWPEQDGDVESDFLSSHLRLNVAGMHGRYPDGSAWLFVLQKAPVDLSARIYGLASDPFRVLTESAERAMGFNPECSLADWFGWTGDQLRAIYRAGAGCDMALVESWSVADLLRGLVANCCSIPLDRITSAYPGCAFPDTSHECHVNTFDDIFAAWSRGGLPAESAHGPASRNDGPLFDFDVSVPGPDLRRRTEDLKKLSLRELCTLARAQGLMGNHLPEGLDKDSMVTILSAFDSSRGSDRAAHGGDSLGTRVTMTGYISEVEAEAVRPWRPLWAITVVHASSTSFGPQWMTTLPLHEAMDVFREGHPIGLVGFNPYRYRDGRLEVDLGPVLMVGDEAAWEELTYRLLSCAGNVECVLESPGWSLWEGPVERMEPTQVKVTNPDSPRP